MLVIACGWKELFSGVIAFANLCTERAIHRLSVSQPVARTTFVLESLVDLWMTPVEEKNINDNSPDQWSRSTRCTSSRMSCWSQRDSSRTLEPSKSRQKQTVIVILLARICGDLRESLPQEPLLCCPGNRVNLKRHCSLEDSVEHVAKVA